MSDDELISIIAHGIADAQGDAYAEYASEFDGYAKAAVDALKKNLAGLSTNGINVWGGPSDIKAVMRALYSDSIIEGIRTQASQWREECGKVHAQLSKRELVLNQAIRLAEIWERNWEPGDDSADEAEFVIRAQKLTEEVRLGGWLK